MRNVLLSNWKVMITSSLLVLMLHAMALSKVVQYSGMCDASASLEIDDNTFIIANDEDNVLRIFRYDQEEPIVTWNLSAFFKIEFDDKSPESDIEGAAKIGDHYFFISSHGRDRKGRLRRNRHQFFALKIDPQTYAIKPVGSSYRKLLDDMMFVPALHSLNLRDAFQPDNKKDESLAPKERGLNIEGLAATPEGTLLIGFRNPIPHGKAIIVELLNPVDVINGQLPRFDKSYLLDMAGRGIRSMEYDPTSDQYMIVGGSRNGDLSSQLYLWDRKSESLMLRDIDFAQMKNLNPEAMHFMQAKTVHISSDDGTVSAVDDMGKTCECKELEDPLRKSFRALVISRDDIF